MAVQHDSAASGQGAFTVTPSDATVFTRIPRCLYVGVTGDVTVKTLAGDDTILFKAVPAGTFMPICVTKVYSTGTTATNILGLI